MVRCSRSLSLPYLNHPSTVVAAAVVVAVVAVIVVAAAVVVAVVVVAVGGMDLTPVLVLVTSLAALGLDGHRLSNSIRLTGNRTKHHYGD